MKPVGEAGGGCPLCACGPAKRLVGLALMAVVVAVVSACVLSAKPWNGPQPGDNGAWEQLTKRLATADEVLVTPGPMFPRTTGATPRPVMVPASVLRSELRLNRHQLGTTCGCPPVVSLEFQKGNARVAVLELIHGRAVRWVDGPWKADALLTRTSAKAVCGILQGQGLAVGLPQWDVR